MKNKKQYCSFFLCLFLGFAVISSLYLSRIYHVAAVVSGSMEPVLPVGSLVCIREAEKKDYKEGDILSYWFGNKEILVTHRLMRITGTGTFIMKGDANSSPDLQEVHKNDVLGKVILTMPGLGYAYLWLNENKKCTEFVLLSVLLIDLLLPAFCKIRKRGWNKK